MILDRRGAELSGANDSSLCLYEKALGEFNCYIGDPVATLDSALAEGPDFAMALAFKAFLFLLGMEKSALPMAREALAAMTARELNARERAHASAIEAFAEGRFLTASEALEDILAEDPHDILALQVGHQLDFFRGESKNLRDRILRVLPDWREDMPGYHALLAMSAFGHEECADYARAEELGRQAVALNRRDGWAHHAVAHVLEMTGRAEEGIEFLEGGAEDWAPESFFAVHNWWHLALFRLEMRDVAGVLALFDAEIKGGKSNVVLDMVDAAALLWRLRLQGHDVADRWQGIADRWQPLIEDRHYAFNDAHAMMALLGAGRRREAERLLAIMAATAEQPDDGLGNVQMTRMVGLPLAKALLAMESGDFGGTIAILRPLRGIARLFGGSHAQRDLLDLTLIEAAGRDNRAGLLRALANERVAAKPLSALALRYRQLKVVGGRV